MNEEPPARPDGYAITQFEETPNPNAVKIWLDRPISDGPCSFRDQEAAECDPLAKALFAAAPITNVFFNGEWMTINKDPDAAWPAVKAKVREVLESSNEQGCS